MNSSAPNLTPTQRHSLRALAHALNPVVSISKKGLTETVLMEIDRCLSAHELIKIRVYDCQREQREALFAELCSALKAAPVQHIGHLLVVWREKPAESASMAPVQAANRRRVTPKLSKKAAAAKTDKAARARQITKGKPRRPTRS